MDNNNNGLQYDIVVFIITNALFYVKLTTFTK